MKVCNLKPMVIFKFLNFITDFLDWGVLCNRGDCYKSLKKIDEALKDYLKA